MKDALPDEPLKANNRVILLSPHRLLPTEEFIEERVLQVTRDILFEGFWLEPILVERTSLVIMDGHHRREFARRKKLRWVPCLLLDYSQVELSSWRPGFAVQPEDIITRGLQGKPYPAKTTRHVVQAWASQRCIYPLSELMQVPGNTDQRMVF